LLLRADRSVAPMIFSLTGVPSFLLFPLSTPFPGFPHCSLRVFDEFCSLVDYDSKCDVGILLIPSEFVSNPLTLDVLRPDLSGRWAAVV